MEDDSLKPGAGDGKRRILVVEDEKTVRNVLERLLRSPSREIVFADCGIDGIGMASVQEFDLLILDLLMPGLSGVEVLEQIRAIRPDVKTIMLSGCWNEESRAAALALGATHVLDKPIDRQTFSALVQEAVGD